MTESRRSTGGAATAEKRATAPADDPDLPRIRRVLDGDETAFSDIVRSHHPGLSRIVTGIIVDRHLADDVLQEVFLIAYRKLPTFRAEARFSTWLTRIAVREAIGARRRWMRLKRLFTSLPEVPSDIKNVEETRESHAAEEEAVVFDLVRRLPLKERAAFVLHAIEEKSYAEVADIMVAPIGTVGSLISRARARLRRSLEGSNDPN